MRLLMTGATGRVGRSTLQSLRQAQFPVYPLGFRHCPPGIESVDLRDFKATADVIRRAAPSVIIHLAGNRNVVFCEKEIEKTRRINYDASAHLCRLAREIDAKMVFISSDYAFDGHSGPFVEDSPPAPQTRYGRDKLEIERLISAMSGSYAIVRSAGIFGIKDDLVGVVRNALMAGKGFTAFSNLYNTPTYIEDFNQMLIKVLSGNIEGTLHCTGSETVSRYQFAQLIAAVFGLDQDRIKAQELDFSKDLRPPSLAMDARHTFDRLGYQPRSIRQALKHMRDTIARSWPSPPT